MKHLLRAAGAFIRDHSGIGLLFALLLAAGVTAAGAQGLTPVLVAPSKPPSAGSQCSVWLYCLNDSPHEVSQTFASSLRATLTSTTGQVSTVLSLNTHHTAPTVTIRPGGFVKAEYWLAVPAAISGQVTPAADNFNPVVFSVAAAALAPASEAAETAAPPPAVAPAQRSGYMVYLGDHLSTYEPIYFILGAGVKFLSTFNPSIQVQYFTGYGQTLRQYDQSSHGLRAGICLWY